jgi:hypothetical protein
MQIGGKWIFISPSRVYVSAPASQKSDVYTEKLFDDHKAFLRIKYLRAVKAKNFVFGFHFSLHPLHPSFIIFACLFLGKKFHDILQVLLKYSF